MSFRSHGSGSSFIGHELYDRMFYSMVPCGPAALSGDRVTMGRGRSRNGWVWNCLALSLAGVTRLHIYKYVSDVILQMLGGRYSGKPTVSEP